MKQKSNKKMLKYNMCTALLEMVPSWGLGLIVLSAVHRH